MFITARDNGPELWLPVFPWPKAVSNKYDRGHTIILGGMWESTGATKLAAHAALRSGAGLVSVACDAQSLPLYATAFQAIMTKLTDAPADFARLIGDSRVKSILVGPGAGVTERTHQCVLEALATAKPTVLDADALRVFTDVPEQLFSAIRDACILTPHAGEFVRLFGAIEPGKELQAAQEAARRSHATVILKGFHTIIAGADGDAVINRNATPFLATAGSGDVLAGICAGLCAQGMPAFDAACAAVWLHAEAGSRFGPGLIAEDIADQLPAILRTLYRP